MQYFTILDKDFKKVANFSKYESLIWKDVYNGYGDFEIYTDVSKLNTFIQDYYITSRDSDEVMIIEDLQIKTDPELGNKLIITGRSLESILDRRILLAQKNYDGNFQTSIQNLLNENIISPSDTSRAIPNFIFQTSADARITALTLKIQLTLGENLYDIIYTLCEVNNLGFKITLNDNNQLVFSLYMGNDRSYSQEVNPYVVFSPKTKNLLNSNYIESIKTLKTFVLVGGEGEGTARKIKTVAVEAGAGTGFGRREMFADAADISSNDGAIVDATYLPLLEQRGKETLAENIETVSFEGQINFDVTYKINIDYFLGDTVQIRNEYGLESRSRIIELVHSHSVTGKSIFPTFKSV